MSTVAQLETSIDTLRESVIQEKAEIKEKLDEQTAAIEAIKAEIETGENPKLDAAVADLEGITADIKGIVNKTPPPAPVD